MRINIGRAITVLRKERLLTQEQLSEVFGVSVAAVSKWETGASYPDIALLPVIADFFDVSVDRLLGYDMSKAAMSIAEHLKKAEVMLRVERKEQEAIAYLGKLAYRYPNNVEILVKYAEAKIICGAWTPRGENRRKLFKEAEDTLLAINTSGLTRNEHDSITKALYGLYLWDKKYDQAEQVLAKLKPGDDQWDDIDGAEFWLYTHKGDMAKAEGIFKSVLEKALAREMLIYGQYHIYYDEPERLIGINIRIIKALRLFEEDFAAFPYEQLSFLHECNAFMYSKLGKTENALEEVKAVLSLSAKTGDGYEPFKNLIHRGENDETAFERIRDTYKDLLANTR